MSRHTGSTQLKRLICQAKQQQNQQLILDSRQRHYLQRVLRLGIGDRFLAVIQSATQTQTWLAELNETSGATLLEQLPPKPPIPVQIHLLAALPKAGFDDVVRQVTELGVASIVPVLSDRTLPKPSPKKLERWRRIAQEATEQCERPDAPIIQTPVSWPVALSQTEAEQKYIAAARAKARHLLPALAESANETVPTVAIAIGPEGGWTETEIDQANAAGYLPITLGPTILRAVTAGPAAVTIIMGRYSAVKMPSAEALPSVNLPQSP